MIERIEQARRVIQEIDVPWDDLRQRRVLGRIEAELEVRTIARRRRHRRFAWAGGMAAACALLGLAATTVRWEADPPAAGRAVLTRDTHEASPPGPEADAIHDPTGDPGTGPMVPSSIALADGSVAHLSAGAHVDVDHQGPEFVRLLQGSGSVRYEVSPDPARRFEIDVRGIEVRVIGTVFTIAVTHASVVVSVERGHVEVDSGDGVSELGPGDVLQVELEHDTAREEDAEATPPEPAAATPARLPATPPQTPDALLQRADAARADGRLADAAAALRTLVRQYRDDPRVYSAYFQLGKVERSRGRHRTAASAFAACVRRAPHGALAEDARAEAAISWRDAGESRRARSTAQAYLQHYPKGAHAARMHRMLARIP